MSQEDYNCKFQLESKIIGCESQGACRQDELIGGKPPTIK
jgi:hypothetical protein